MKSIFFIFSMLFIAFNANAQQSILGIWNTGKENTTIEILEIDGKIEGFIYESDYQNAPKGKLMIKNITYKNQSYLGKLYIIKKDRWVNAVFVKAANNLKVTISAGFQKKTVEWEKVNE